MEILKSVENEMSKHFVSHKFICDKGVTDSSIFARFKGTHVSILFEIDTRTSIVVCYICDNSILADEISERKIPIERLSDFFGQFSDSIYIPDSDFNIRLSKILSYITRYAGDFIEGKNELCRVEEFYKGFLHAQTYHAMGL